MRLRIIEFRRQCAGRRIAPPIGELGGQDPRGACAEKNTDPLAAIPCAGGSDLVAEPVLGES